MAVQRGLFARLSFRANEICVGKIRTQRCPLGTSRWSPQPYSRDSRGSTRPGRQRRNKALCARGKPALCRSVRRDAIGAAAAHEKSAQRRIYVTEGTYTSEESRNEMVGKRGRTFETIHTWGYPNPRFRHTAGPDARGGGHLAVHSRPVTCASSVERVPSGNVPTAPPPYAISAKHLPEE